MKLDFAILGGGLSAGLVAARLASRFPNLNWRLFEQSKSLGGNHTWCFHDADVPQGAWPWLRPMVAKSWVGYDVNFPGWRRRLGSGYHGITSHSFHEALMGQYGERISLGVQVQWVEPGTLVLPNGETFTSDIVFDARGLSDLQAEHCGFQKFVGWEIELESPHRLKRPLLMDATVPQKDGYRFFYVLPWTDTKLLVEDTYYSDSPELDVEQVREEIARYLGNRGWRMQKLLREEVGCLPIPLSKKYRRTAPQSFDIGNRGDYFQPTTGYSMPYGLRVAMLVGDSVAWDPQALSEKLEAFQRETFSRHEFFRLLNRMLFRGCEPQNRWKIFARFYRLRESLIQGFYSGRLRWWQRLRILSGKPPIPIGRALKCLRDPFSDDDQETHGKFHKANPSVS